MGTSVSSMRENEVGFLFFPCLHHCFSFIMLSYKLVGNFVCSVCSSAPLVLYSCLSRIRWFTCWLDCKNCCCWCFPFVFDSPKLIAFMFRCVIAELFLEGQPVFELSQLLAYRRGQYDPSQHLEKVSNKHLK